jgi:hypothetical protein
MCCIGDVQQLYLCTLGTLAESILQIVIPHHTDCCGGCPDRLKRCIACVIPYNKRLVTGKMYFLILTGCIPGRGYSYFVFLAVETIEISLVSTHMCFFKEKAIFKRTKKGGTC